METNKLILEFLDTSNKKFLITIDNPRSDLDPTEVKTAMESIVSDNVFTSADGELVGLGEARLVTTTINKIDLE